jgi:hypothetical protein
VLLPEWTRITGTISSVYAALVMAMMAFCPSGRWFDRARVESRFPEQGDPAALRAEGRPVSESSVSALRKSFGGGRQRCRSACMNARFWDHRRTGREGSIACWASCCRWSEVRIDGKADDWDASLRPQSPWRAEPQLLQIFPQLSVRDHSSCWSGTSGSMFSRLIGRADAGAR